MDSPKNTLNNNSVFETLAQQKGLLKELEAIVNFGVERNGADGTASSPQPMSKALALVDMVQEHNRMIMSIIESLQPLK